MRRVENQRQAHAAGRDDFERRVVRRRRAALLEHPIPAVVHPRSRLMGQLCQAGARLSMPGAILYVVDKDES